MKPIQFYFWVYIIFSQYAKASSAFLDAIQTPFNFSQLNCEISQINLAQNNPQLLANITRPAIFFIIYVVVTIDLLYGPENSLQKKTEFRVQ